MGLDKNVCMVIFCSQGKVMMLSVITVNILCIMTRFEWVNTLLPDRLTPKKFEDNLKN